MPLNPMTTNTTATAAAISIGTQIAMAIYDNITGNVYSKQEKTQLNELKQLYQRCLEVAPPLYWELDEHNKPTHCVKNQKWALYLSQLKQVKESFGYYHYQSYLIAEYASTYLIERQHRWLGKGKAGDLSEQFFGEWIYFALHDLPTFRVDESSIKQFKNRLRYIEHLQKNERLFQYGWIKYEKNEAETIENIKRQIQTCLKIAEKESARQCIRDQLHCCRIALSRFLLASAQTMYYARGTSVTCEPFHLHQYVDTKTTFSSAMAKKLYPQLKKTHTGAMLNEIIHIAGLEAFGCLEPIDEEENNFQYFETRFELIGIKKSFIHDVKKYDCPLWVAENDKPTCLKNWHDLGEHMLRVAQVKELVEIAYDLAGKIGDVWAYGDHQGKLSLQALVFLLEQEMNLLKTHYDDIYQYHQDKRQAYNLANRINPDQGANPNFNKVDDQEREIEGASVAIQLAIAAMRNQLNLFPADEKSRTDRKKEIFYHSLYKYIKHFYPTLCQSYQLLAGKEVAEKEPRQVHFDEQQFTHYAQRRSTKSHPIRYPVASSTSLSDENISFEMPLKYHERYRNHLYLDKPVFKLLDEHLETFYAHQDAFIWKVGNAYDYWIANYFVLHKCAFEIFQRFAFALQEMIRTQADRDKIAMVTILFKQHIFSLKQTLNEEKPAWRFQLSWWPIKTMGWPFNKRARLFAELLLKELEVTRVKVEKLTLFKEEVSTQATTTQPHMAICSHVSSQYHATAQPNVSTSFNTLTQPTVLAQSCFSSTALVVRTLTDQINDDSVARQQLTSAVPLSLIQYDQKHASVTSRSSQWFNNILEAWKCWNNTQSFYIFNQLGDFKVFLEEIMSFFDSLEPMTRSDTLKVWNHLFDLVQLEIDGAINRGDKKSAAQMQLVIVMKTVLCEMPLTKRRKQAEVHCLEVAKALFSEQQNVFAPDVVNGYTAITSS